MAAREEGIDALFDALTIHLDALKASGELDARRRATVHARVLDIARDLVAEALTGADAEAAGALLERVVRRELAPHPAARALLEGVRRAGRN